MNKTFFLSETTNLLKLKQFMNIQVSDTCSHEPLIDMNIQVSDTCSHEPLIDMNIQVSDTCSHEPLIDILLVILELIL